MSESMFRIYRGLELDEASQFLTGSGAPGAGGDTAAAPRGSYFTDTSTGALYMKVSSGTGTDKWSQLATQSYVQNLSASGTSWREPVAVVDSASATTGAIITDLNADDLIQGVAVTVGMRILGAAVTGNKNVFVVGGSTGAWTLTEDANAESQGDTVYVDAGTDAGKTYQYNGTNWVWINSADSSELGYIRTFIGKNGAGSETPTYSSTTVVTNSESLESAIGKLDAEAAYQNTFMGKTAGNDTPTYSSNNFTTNGASLETAIGGLDAEFGPNVVNGTVILAANTVNANITALDTEMGSIESYLGKTVGTSAPSYSSVTVVTQGSAVNTAISALDAAADLVSHKSTVGGVTTITTIDTIAGALVAEWDIRCVDAADSTKVYAAKVFATQNGVTADFSKFAVLKLGAVITGLSITVDLSGGALRLRVASTDQVDVVARRLSALS